MELERYRALLCAIEKGSLSAAGEAMGYTPSGISRMMAALEEGTAFPCWCAGGRGWPPPGAVRRCSPSSGRWSSPGIS